MQLEEQIFSLIFSLLYGIFVMYIYDYLNVNKMAKKYKILNIIFFCINITLIYFLLCKRINNGSIHVYFILAFIVGIIIYKNFIK